ncbi:PREDICTED: PHD finger protein At2g01810-like [Nicotiana attenuata]|uniref:Phd finger protein n=1 Tax=Nicotiana attenuata TaxID=49451 RepID=A0A1J6JDC2_NICAT|nr:PREDICTED: PHD finger protein At2g01810-like [Nicotiana attenuata]OIT05073.1 phd finger protein [Nicotiana attenuata]
MASSTIIEACKSRKRNRKPFVFETFATGNSIDGFSGPFKDNIRMFLQEFANVEDYTVSGFPIWSTWLMSNSTGAVFPLYTIEETTQLSLNPFCDHCKFSGWGHHYVSKRRYHLVIPANENWEKPLGSDSIEIDTHVLHGLIHSNGYGHLLSISNGVVNGDSNLLSGTDFMDFWDRLCTVFNTRKISVNDVSKKGGMELRLLHGVAYGQSWFGKWDYRFGRGSYGVTEQKYEIAVQFLSSLGLDKILNDFKRDIPKRLKIKQIIGTYRELSEIPLITISDLFQFMLAFKSKAPFHSKMKLENRDDYWCDPDIGEKHRPISMDTFVNLMANNDCRWPARRLEFVLIVIVNLLKENQENVNRNYGMTRQDLRDEARKCIGDTGLIDFVLKSIRCFQLGNQIIRRSINPNTKLLEFTIHEAANKEAESIRFPVLDKDSGCRWTERKVKKAAEFILKILRAHNGDGAMSRQELRDKARTTIRDTGLIDYVLKSLNKSMMGNKIIFRSKNPSTKRIEFAFEDIVEASRIENIELDFTIDQDLEYLYETVLLSYPGSDSVSLATRVVLDSKKFVKKWKLENQESQIMALTCKVLPSFDELESELTRPLSPGVVVYVPPWITIRELKGVAQLALRDTYCIMQNFVVTQIGGLKGIEDKRMLSCAVGRDAHVWVRGRGLDLDTELRYEGGPIKLKVDCICGARDDDGERMVICDACQVWFHTTCSGIDDQEVPAVFLCESCRNF